MLKRFFVSAAILAASVALASPGGAPPAEPAPSGGASASRHGMMGMLGGNLYPPESVLENRTALGLTDDQVTAIAKEISAAHDRVQPIQDSLRAAADQLRTLLEKPQVDEAAALAAAGQAMDLEKQIKTAHMGMMIRVKNLLNADQQSKMKDIRAAHPGPMGRMFGSMPPIEGPVAQDSN